MFYKMIERARDRWYASPDCTVTDLIGYMIQKGYANDPDFKHKRSFMEREFTQQNNKAFGYERFEYLYLEDSFPDADRIRLTHEMICAFFEER